MGTFLYFIEKLKFLFSRKRKDQPHDNVFKSGKESTVFTDSTFHKI